MQKSATSNFPLVTLSLIPKTSLSGERERDVVFVASQLAAVS